MSLPYDISAELAELESEVSTQVEAAIYHAEMHMNHEAARLLSEISERAFQFIAKPAEWDAAVNTCLDGPSESNGKGYGHLEANLGVIKDTCREIEDLKSGKTRPKSTEPPSGSEIAELRSSKFSDKANATRFADMYKEDLRHSIGEWLEWTLWNWKVNQKGAEVRAHTVGLRIREELLLDGVTDGKIAEVYYKAALNADNERGQRGIFRWASSLPEFNGDSIKWDADPWLFNCPNGTIDLRTGELREHRREDYITALCPTRYNPDAKAPGWERFLREIFDGDEELIEYIRWALCYSITGLQKSHVIFICHGSGANGKSTLFHILYHVLGDTYIHTLSSDELVVRKHQGHRAPLAQLRGKRLVVVNETDENGKLNVSRVKELSGGDRISANLMHQNPTSFDAECKVWLATNHRPSIQDKTDGIWRRIRLIPFNVSFMGDRADPNIGERLEEEAEGILAWLVEGAQRIEDAEPELPDAVKVATESYRAEEDTLSQFLDDECEMWEHATVSSAALYGAYKVYMNNRCESKKKFGQYIKAKGFESSTLNHGTVRTWKGLRLKDIEDNDLH